MQCKSDVLVFHEQHIEKESIQAMHITLIKDEVEEIETGMAQLKLDGTFDMKGSVAELKVHDCDAAAENECIYNIFGEAVKLTANALSKGRIVKTVCMYGILVSIHNHQEALLFKLQIYFFERKCIFEISRKSTLFVVLLNQVLSNLEQ